jgi:phosphoribosylaminoimidazole (AIR) synthetase
MPKLDFSAVGAFIEKLKPGYQDKMDRQKLATVFQLNNEVREVATGHVFKVFDMKLGMAFLIDARDNVKMVDWHTSAGHLKGYIADDWELVKAANSAAEPSVNWHMPAHA